MREMSRKHINKSSEEMFHVFKVSLLCINKYIIVVFQREFEFEALINEWTAAC